MRTSITTGTLVAQSLHATSIKTPRPKRLQSRDALIKNCKKSCVVVRLGNGERETDLLSALRDAMIDARDASSHLNRFDPFKISVLWYRSSDSDILGGILGDSEDNTIMLALDMASCRGRRQITKRKHLKSFKMFFLESVVPSALVRPHKTWPELEKFCASKKNQEKEL